MRIEHVDTCPANKQDGAGNMFVFLINTYIYIYINIVIVSYFFSKALAMPYGHMSQSKKVVELVGRIVVDDSRPSKMECSFSACGIALVEKLFNKIIMIGYQASKCLGVISAPLHPPPSPQIYDS